MLFIGIDMSKLTFDAAYFKDNGYVHKQFDNRFKPSSPGLKRTLMKYLFALKPPVFIALG